MVRSPLNSVSVELKRGAWNVEEDRKLVDYIKRYGIWNWNQMPQAAGLMRSGKSCRLRWLNYLRPNIRHGNFNRQEEDIIIKWHKLLGNKWSTIATKLPGRTDNEIKNIWNTYLKKRTMSDQSMQQPKMSAAPPAVMRDKTTQPCKSLSGESVFDRSSSSTSPVSSIDNRTETESEGEGNNGLQADTTVVSPGYSVWVSELHDNVIFDDICGGFLPNYYQQEALTNEWVIGDLWTR